MSVESGSEFTGNYRVRVDIILFGSREHIWRVFPHSGAGWAYYNDLRKWLGKKYTDIQIGVAGPDDEVVKLLKVEHGQGSNFDPKTSH